MCTFFSFYCFSFYLQSSQNRAAGVNNLDAAGVNNLDVDFYTGGAIYLVVI